MMIKEAIEKLHNCLGLMSHDHQFESIPFALLGTRK